VNVVVADLDVAAAGVVAEELLPFGGRALAAGVDVSRPEEMEALAERAYDEFGTVEILSNNAGVALRPLRASWDTTLEDYRWVMNVNFWGVLHGHHSFVPRMRATPGLKHIVNTSSIASVVVAAGTAAYSASKAAVDALSITARKELRADGIGVTLLQPGAVRTAIATSERLRRPEERSSERGVIPWSDYPGADHSAASSGSNGLDPDVPMSMRQYITPNAVGWLVIQAIERDLQHVFTHPLDAEVWQQRTEAILAGEPDYSEFPRG